MTGFCQQPVQVDTSGSWSPKHVGILSQLHGDIASGMFSGTTSIWLARVGCFLTKAAWTAMCCDTKKSPCWLCRYSMGKVSNLNLHTHLRSKKVQQDVPRDSSWFQWCPLQPTAATGNRSSTTGSVCCQMLPSYSPTISHRLSHTPHPSQGLMTVRLKGSTARLVCCGTHFLILRIPATVSFDIDIFDHGMFHVFLIRIHPSSVMKLPRAPQLPEICRGGSYVIAPPSWADRALLRTGCRTKVGLLQFQLQKENRHTMTELNYVTVTLGLAFALPLPLQGDTELRPQRPNSEHLNWWSRDFGGPVLLSAVFMEGSTDHAAAGVDVAQLRQSASGIVVRNKMERGNPGQVKVVKVPREQYLAAPY